MVLAPTKDLILTEVQSPEVTTCTTSVTKSLQSTRSSTVVKVLCYKSEGRWFDPSWCHSFRSHYGPGVDSTSNINEYQEHFLGVKAAAA